MKHNYTFTKTVIKSVKDVTTIGIVLTFMITCTLKYACLFLINAGATRILLLYTECILRKRYMHADHKAWS